MKNYDQVCEAMHHKPKVWLITGVAGFIGSNLLETLLKLNQHVIGLDNFATGYQHNLDEIKASLAEIGKIEKYLGYKPHFDIHAGVKATMPWYVKNSGMRS